MEVEEWRVIPEYPDYQVSNLGRVKSFKCDKETILKPIINNKYGYLKVRLYKNGLCKNFLIHRLVISTFLKLKETEDVDHIDGHPENNNIKNLRKCNKIENGKNRICCNNSGFMGVYFNKRCKKYISHIRINGKLKYLGNFENPCDAFEVYKQASIKYRGVFSPFICRKELMEDHIYFDKNYKKYKIEIKINGELKYLGYFEDPYDAVEAYKEASLKFFGEFSPFNSRKELVEVQ